MGTLSKYALPDCKTVIKKMPLSSLERDTIDNHTAEIREILSGINKRLLLIVGPCSAWPHEAVLEYAAKLRVVAEKHKNALKIVMRTYVQKPRTTMGWEGPMNQPDPFLPSDLEEGIYYCRNMLRDVIRLGLPIADEALYLHNEQYLADLFSWKAIGARSSEDPEHRRFVSMSELPFGIKHPRSGDIQNGIESIKTAQHPHLFSFMGYAYETTGNPFAHLVLRGAKNGPNFDEVSINSAINLLEQFYIKNPAILVDASHENSQTSTGERDQRMQHVVIESVLSSMQKNVKIREYVKGFMLESFIIEGRQDIKKIKNGAKLVYGQSITDACMGLEETTALIEMMANTVDGLNQNY